MHMRVAERTRLTLTGGRVTHQSSESTVDADTSAIRGGAVRGGGEEEGPDRMRKQGRWLVCVAGFVAGRCTDTG